MIFNQSHGQPFKMVGLHPCFVSCSRVGDGSRLFISDTNLKINDVAYKEVFLKCIVNLIMKKRSRF